MAGLSPSEHLGMAHIQLRAGVPATAPLLILLGCLVAAHAQTRPVVDGSNVPIPLTQYKNCGADNGGMVLPSGELLPKLTALSLLNTLQAATYLFQTVATRQVDMTGWPAYSYGTCTENHTFVIPGSNHNTTDADTVC